MSLIVPGRTRSEQYCRPPAAAALWTARLAILASLAIAAVLWYFSGTPGGPPGCGSGGPLDCDAVLGSRYARWFGVPVSLLSLLLYAGTLLALFGVGPGTSARTQRDAWRLLLVAALVLIGAALWFIGLQVFVLHAVCAYCLVAHLCGLVTAGIILFLGPLRVPGEEADGRPVRPLALRGALGLALLSSLSLAALVVGQHFGPSTWQIELAQDLPDDPAPPSPAPAPAADQPAAPPAAASAPDSATGASESAPASDAPPADDPPPAGDTAPPAGDPTADAPPATDPATSPDSANAPPADDPLSAPAAPVEPIDLVKVLKLPTFTDRQRPQQELDPAALLRVAPAAPSVDEAPQHRLVSVWRAGQVDLADHPVLGARRAPQVAVKLYDYTCSHCRTLHQYLNLAQQRFGDDQLAIVLLPVPLNKKCNPHIEGESARHRDSCEYAKLALAVFRAQPDQFAEFHHWLMRGVDVPTLKQAIAQAEKLLTADRLRETLADSWINERLQENVLLYKLCGGKLIPKLTFGKYLVVGEPKDEEQLYEFFEQRSQLRPKQP